LVGAKYKSKSTKKSKKKCIHAVFIKECGKGSGFRKRKQNNLLLLETVHNSVCEKTEKE
jgi:hypothetical protein